MYKVGNKVTLKTVDELVETGFNFSPNGDVVHGANKQTPPQSRRIMLWEYEKKYCGQTGEVIEVRVDNWEEYGENTVIYKIRMSDGNTIYNLTEESFQPEPTFTYQKAVEALQSKQCDAIKFADNDVTGAYLKGGKLYMCRIYPFGSDFRIIATNQLFETYPEYVVGQWTLHKDRARRALILENKRQIASKAMQLVHFGAITYEEREEILQIIK